MALGKLRRAGDKLTVENVSGTPKIFFVEQFGFNNFLNDAILKWIDTLAANGVNGMRVFGFWPFAKGNQEEAFVKINPTKYDLTRFNEPYFDHLKRWVTYANEKNIVILFELFDSCGFWNAQYAPYNPFFPIVGSDHKAFSNLKNTSLVDLQKRYIQKIVAAIKPNLNVILGIMNEFDGDPQWHYEMSRYVKSLVPDNLTAGSCHGCPAANDPNVDFWFVHKGSYNINTGVANVPGDIGALRNLAGSQKVLGYSTDGFGQAGKIRENPTDMRRLAQDVVNTGLQLFGFLDHAAYDLNTGGGSVSQLNVATYQAIVPVFKPTPLIPPPPPVVLPTGMLYVFQAKYLESEHPNVISEKGGKVVAAATTKGYLCLSPQIKNFKEKPLPIKPLAAYFSLLVDDNAKDDAILAIVDVYDAAAQTVLANAAITRKQFAKPNEFALFKLTFTPAEKSKVVLRVYYFGVAYLAVDKIALVEPDKITINSPKDIPDAHSSVPAEPDVKPVVGLYNVSGLPHTHPDVFPDKGGNAIKATTKDGFLCYGPYVTGYPVKPLDVYFSIYIDNNSADNAKIVTLDIHDLFQQKVLAQMPLTRKQFPLAGDFNVFKLSVTPIAQSNLEFRIFYHGWAYIAADLIAVVDPAEIQLKTHAEMLKLSSSENNGGNGGNGDQLVIDDPLTNNKSLGVVNGGKFTPEGYKMTTLRNACIMYETTIKKNIRIEFDAKGYIDREPADGKDNTFFLFVMHDAERNTRWDQESVWAKIPNYLYQIRKEGLYILDGKPLASTNGISFKAGCQVKNVGFERKSWNAGQCLVAHPLEWNPNTLYHWKITVLNGRTEVFRNGIMIFSEDCTTAFAPQNRLIVYVGGTLYGKCNAQNVTYANVKIYQL